MYSTTSNVSSKTVLSHSANVDMLRLEEPHATSSMLGSSQRISLADSRASVPYSRAVLAPICHGASISLPKHQSLTAWGDGCPCSCRKSLSIVPLSTLQYSSSALASSAPLVPRFTAIIGSRPAFAHQAINSFVPNAFVSVLNQASSRRRGRLSSGPTPSSQL